MPSALRGIAFASSTFRAEIASAISRLPIRRGPATGPPSVCNGGSRAQAVEQVGDDVGHGSSGVKRHASHVPG